MSKLKKYRVGFKEIEYGWVEVSAMSEAEAHGKADEIISQGNANYGKNEREFDNPVEIEKFEEKI